MGQSDPVVDVHGFDPLAKLSASVFLLNRKEMTSKSMVGSLQHGLKVDIRSYQFTGRVKCEKTFPVHVSNRKLF